MMCQHCDEPACREACPAEAIDHAPDGTVRIDPDLCIRCGDCEAACPYGVIDLLENGTPLKCDLCQDRREMEWLPSCVQHCPGRALYLATAQTLAEYTAGKTYSWRTGRVVYLSDKWSSLGSDASSGPARDMAVTG